MFQGFISAWLCPLLGFLANVVINVVTNCVGNLFDTNIRNDIQRRPEQRLTCSLPGDSAVKKFRYQIFEWDRNWLEVRRNRSNDIQRRPEQRLRWSEPSDSAVEKFLYQIFEWEPNWLEEQKYLSEPPPIVNEENLVAMPTVYRTYEEYNRIVMPLLTLELWHRISKNYEEEKKKSPCRYSVSKCTTNVSPVRRVESNISILGLNIVNEDPAKPPVHGNLVIFNYTSKWSSGCGSSVQKAFAYIASVSSGRSGARASTPCTTYVVWTRKLVAANLRPNDLQFVSYIRPDMRPVEALRYLPTSPLGKIILHPKIEDYLLPVVNLHGYPLVTKDRLNAKQLEAVARITEVVAREIPRICLIHGPPGTGKSQVIVNLIMQIIRGGRGRLGCEKTRILMCAPSNTAVDEVVLRLMNVNRTLGERGESPFSLVRVGRAEVMNPSAEEVSLRNLAKRRVERLYGYHRMEERAKIAKICQGEEWLLRNADVIACTLNSCYSDKMKSIFGGSAAISVCIVDEATQCVEPDTLIPLMLGVRTLVLVGDTKQLPATVISQKAKQLGLDQSLFARISKVFECEWDNPIIKLDTQYRMPDAIALFPNRHFYDGALKNAAVVRELPLHFYRVFNLDSTQSADKFSNSNEANFVANLMYTLMARANYGDAILPISIGVITPYNNQKELLRKRIRERISCLKDQKKIDYEVNTVDSFQGQERDVMIMSCVRSDGIGFLGDRQRLCVALTRAKHSLILCGNFKTFQKNCTWRALLNDAKRRKVYMNLQAVANPDTIEALIVRTDTNRLADQVEEDENSCFGA